MINAHNKVAIVGKWWGGIIAILVTTFAIGSFSFAWNTNSQQATTQMGLSYMQTQITGMQEAKLPERMATIEAVTKSTNDKVDDIKEMQRESGRKLDLLVQGQIDDRHEMKPAR